MESPPSPLGKKTLGDEDNKLDDSGIGELDTTTNDTSSSSPAAATTRQLASQVPRICTRDEKNKNKNKRRRQQQMKSVFPQQASFDRSTVSLGRKIVKKALKTRQKMENNKELRDRTYALLKRLCQNPTEEPQNGETDDNKNVEFEEPPPRPPTRRCMFYREDSDQPKGVLRVKQL